jgi:hypothetical protein
VPLKTTTFSTFNYGFSSFSCGEEPVNPYPDKASALHQSWQEGWDYAAQNHADEVSEYDECSEKDDEEWKSCCGCQ